MTKSSSIGAEFLLKAQPTSDNPAHISKAAFPYWAYEIIDQYFLTINKDAKFVDRVLREDTVYELQYLKKDIQASQTDKQLLLVYGTQGKIVGAERPYQHAIAISYDPQTNTLIYQNSNGVSMPDHLKDFFNGPELKDIKVIDTQLHQQRDSNSCGYFAFYNLVCLAQHVPMQEDIDIDTLRYNVDIILSDLLKVQPVTRYNRHLFNS
jgi:hypothetical protein|tara:strand:+ start:1137 stop:1760 length:624 start_codon:yes stop_codon:yes gene_type:complete